MKGIRRAVCFILVTIILASCKNITNNTTSYDNMLTNTIPQKYESVVNNQDSANYIITEKVEVNELGVFGVPAKWREMTSLALSIENVEDVLGVQCIRNGNNNSVYSVHKVILEDGRDGYCFISYYNGRVIDGWTVFRLTKKIDFITVRKGKTTYEDIVKIDPATTIINQCSYHRFKDGTMLEIEYEQVGEKSVVCGLSLFKDPVDILHCLLPVDIELIE